MHIHRLQELSIYYWLQDLFFDVSGVNVEDGFPTGTLIIPTISIDTDILELSPFELGNLEQAMVLWYIDIFAKNKVQRDEFGYRILDALKTDGVTVYNYDEGFPPDVIPTVIGHLHPSKMKLRRHKVIPDLDKLFWRTTINFITEYEER